MLSDVFFDECQIDQLKERYLRRVIRIHGDNLSKKFMAETLRDVYVWLSCANINFYKPRGLLSPDLNGTDGDEKTYHGYMSYVHSTLLDVSQDEFPEDVRPYTFEDIELASAILQLYFRATDKYGIAYVEEYFYELEKRDLRLERDERKEESKLLYGHLERHLLRPKEIASRSRSKRLVKVLKDLVTDSGSKDPKVLWLLLIQRFHDLDPVIRGLFDDVIPDESGLKQQNALKSAPYKFVYMESIQSGKSKGEEKYLTYQRFRAHIKKITA